MKPTYNSLAVIVIFAFFLFWSNQAYAHPGNTASDGCHYCRTNCDKWGVPWNERHCHNETGSMSKEDKSDSNLLWYGLFGLGGLGLGYYFFKKKDD